MKKEIHIFFTALMFFTRIPCPGWIDHSPEYLTKSARYFPLVGIIVGGIGGLVYYLSAFIFPHSISLILSMTSTILATGAFHEDGLADMCDGFGGGWTKENILRIMKDSRVGTYGMVGLVFVLALKFACLFQVDPKIIPFVLIAGHALSRYAASTLLYTLEYVRDDADSKAKPAAGKMSLASLVVGGIFGILPLALFLNPYFLLLIIPVYLMRWYLARFFVKWIGGQTGDCGGATQQLCEVVFYLSWIALWKFI
jgi:adenosylcobinamide-GDP ribazoletransferase